MKKVMVFVAMVICFSNLLTAQTSDTVRSGNGTTIVNIGVPPTGNAPRRNTQPARRPQQTTPVPTPTYMPEQRPVYVVNNDFLSDNGRTWWLIILSILGFGAIVALLFLVSRRSSCAGCSINCRCNGYNSNGSMSHVGNINHNGNINHAGDLSHTGTVNHSGVVEHHHYEMGLILVPVTEEEKTLAEKVEKKD